MNKNARNKLRLMRPADGALALALMIAAFAGRNEAVLSLMSALYGVKLCALASSEALRAAFSRQPSMRYVQGSAVIALGMQCAGGLIAAALCALLRLGLPLWLFAWGIIMNIEAVYYEYLYAIGDGQSAVLGRGITSVLTLTGTLLCVPRGVGIDSASPVWPLATASISALAALGMALALGGRPRPRYSDALPRCCGMATLRTGLYPLAALVMTRLLQSLPAAAALVPAAPAIPVCAGLVLYRLCGTPYRRTPSESGPMNLALLVVCAAAALCASALQLFRPAFPGFQHALYSCCTLPLAALCALIMYGNLKKTEA